VHDLARNLWEKLLVEVILIIIKKYYLEKLISV